MTAMPMPSPDAPRPKLGHRPRKLAQPDQREKILAALRLGVPRVHAAKAAGTSDDTITREMARDAAFAEAVARAESQAVERCVGLVMQAAITDWRAAAWMLERRHREDFAQRFGFDAAVGTNLRFTLDINGASADQPRVIDQPPPD